MNDQDWTGNGVSVYATLGASSHSEETRAEYDYYATDPMAVELLLAEETFSEHIWECAVGEGHMSVVLEEYGYDVKSTDIVYRGFGEKEPVDFLAYDETYDGDIITNPPYKYASEFVRKAMEVTSPGSKVAMFLKLQFLESKGRRELFKEFPPKTVYVSSARLLCAKNGDFAKKESSAVAYAWYVWENGWHGDPVIKWIN